MSSLGIIQDSKLSWYPQVNQATKKLKGISILSCPAPQNLSINAQLRLLWIQIWIIAISYILEYILMFPVIWVRNYKVYQTQV